MYRQKIKYNVEKLVLKDSLNENEDNKLTIIEELLTYNFDEFNINIPSEQIVCDVKRSYENILSGVNNGCKEIELQDVMVMNGIVEEYERILKKYLEDHGRRGKLSFSTRRINDTNPYFNYYLYLRRYMYKEK